jgi:hypothetical protein
MHKIRIGLLVICMLLCAATSAPAQVSIGIGAPGVSIGINVPLYPQLVPVPGYPVYYAPNVNANYFFYDGMYWLFQYGNWYASTWYNGPWAFVNPVVVPVFILRIPVRYYRVPPVYFRGWQPNAPPHWGEHWGHGWEQHRRGWNTWNRGNVPARAPLPNYQRYYPGNRYPRVDQQRTIRNRYYGYQPHNTIIRQHYQGQRAPATVQPGKRQAPPQQQGPAFQGQRQYPGAEQHIQQAPRYQGHEQRSREPDRGHGQGQIKGEERGGKHNK